MVNIMTLYTLYFVRSGEGIKSEVPSMPDVFQMSIDEIIEECTGYLSGLLIYYSVFQM